jgi:alkylhydroperoxidase family enzyme
MATAKTEILIATEINAATGEVTERPMTAEELSQRKIDEAEAAAQLAAKEAKAATRASALAKLKELGLTEQEIAAL